MGGERRLYFYSSTEHGVRVYIRFRSFNLYENDKSVSFRDPAPSLAWGREIITSVYHTLNAVLMYFYNFQKKKIKSRRPTK